MRVGKKGKTVVLVGLGSIGRYHLQGLFKLKGNVNIKVVTTNKKACELVKKSVPKPNNINIEFLEDINSVPENSDLTIIATIATDRPKIINNLLLIGHRSFLIEKMVCQSKNEYDLLLENFQKHKARGWVNTIRRYNEFYRKLIPYFTGKSFAFTVVAGDGGLGTNAIHFLDTFEMLNGSRVKLYGGCLSKELLPNKRGKGLVEFRGTIIGRADNESFLSISFLPHVNNAGNVSIVGEDARAFVDEVNGRAFLATRTNKWHWIEHKYREPMVSEIIPVVAKDIFEKGHCFLPTIEDSYGSHVELFRIFNKHLRQVTYRTFTKCPIT